mmetsp:Transcript_152972/g.281962  ORF Transcript_152972/g.281962 Transcript_152972/m.281962 type:complete len:263 (+) Transcript_152972:181-969(+)
MYTSANCMMPSQQAASTAHENRKAGQAAQVRWAVETGRPALRCHEAIQTGPDFKEGNELTLLGSPPPPRSLYLCCDREGQHTVQQLQNYHHTQKSCPSKWRNLHSGLLGSSAHGHRNHIHSRREQFHPHIVAAALHKLSMMTRSAVAEALSKLCCVPLSIPPPHQQRKRCRQPYRHGLWALLATSRSGAPSLRGTRRRFASPPLPGDCGLYIGSSCRDKEAAFLHRRPQSHPRKGCQRLRHCRGLRCHPPRPRRNAQRYLSQ